MLPNWGFTTSAIPMVLKAADDAAISSSDYMDLSVNSTRRRCTRPLVDGQGYEYAAPGARIARFTTNSKTINAQIRFTNLITRVTTYNGTGAILADGVKVGTYTCAYGGGLVSATVTFTTATNRVIEFICPHGASVDFEGVYVVQGATFTAAPAAPTDKVLIVADSIFHGYNASEVAETSAFKLRQLRGVQVLNCGYGGASAGSFTATSVAAGTGAGKVWYALGYNNFYPGVSLSATKANIKTGLALIRTALPSARIYVQSMIATGSTASTYGRTPGDREPSDYRTTCQAAFTEWGDANSVFVDGLTILPTASGLSGDLIHPADSGMTTIATNVNVALNG